MNSRRGNSETSTTSCECLKDMGSIFCSEFKGTVHPFPVQDCMAVTNLTMRAKLSHEMVKPDVDFKSIQKYMQIKMIQIIK